MPISKRTRPYEFLVRWGPEGIITGAHVQFTEEVVEGTSVLSARPGDAIPVSMAGEAGFPLADILTQLHVDAVATTSARIAEAAELRKQMRLAEDQRDEAMNLAQEMKAVRDQLQVDLQRLREAHDDAKLLIAAMRAAKVPAQAHDGVPVTS